MTPTPAPRDERELFQEVCNIGEKAVFINGRYAPAGFTQQAKDEADFANMIWPIWSARAALAESELAEVRLQNEIATHNLESLRGHHDACIKDAYRILGIDGSDGEFRYKWVSLELSGIVRERDELRAELERVTKEGDRYHWLQRQTSYRFKKIQDASVTDGGDVFYFHADRFDRLVDAAIDASRDGEGGGV